MSVSIITLKEAKPLLEQIGSLLFPSKYRNCAHYCKLDEITRKYKLKRKIKYVLVIANRNSNDADFKNIANKNIAYSRQILCDASADGAMPYGQKYVMLNPLGDAIIVV